MECPLFKWIQNPFKDFESHLNQRVVRGGYVKTVGGMIDWGVRSESDRRS